MLFKNLHKKDIMELLCPVFFLTCTFFIFGPIELYVSNITELWFSFGDVLWPSLLTFFIVSIFFFIIGLLEHPAEREEMVRSACDYAKRELSWESLADQYARLIDVLMGKKRLLAVTYRYNTPPRGGQRSIWKRYCGGLRLGKIMS